jgi:hypothetical protein
MKRGLVSLAVACVVAVVACSGGDPNGGSVGDGGRSTTSLATTTTVQPSTTTSTDPPATDVEALQPVLDALIDRYDEAVVEILRDPRVAADVENTVVRRYRELFVADSDFPEVALEHWANEGAAGRFYRAGPLGRMYDSTVVSVEAVSDDEVSFEVCTLRSIVIVDNQGEEVGAEGGATGGSIVAERVGGRWLLRDLTRTEAPASCPRPQEGA